MLALDGYFGPSLGQIIKVFFLSILPSDLRFFLFTFIVALVKILDKYIG